MDINLPNLGEGADSGTIVNLLVKEGDRIAKDQPLLELENEKAVATIPSPAAGTVTRVFVKAGDKISVGQRILSLSEGKTDASEPSAKVEAAPEPKTQKEPSRGSLPGPNAADAPAEVAVAQSRPGIAPAAAPSIRKLASELGIDLTRVSGSAGGGRIVLADLRAYVQSLQARAAGRAAPAASAERVPKPQPIDFGKWGPITEKPFSPLRQVIARRMAESWSAVPRVTQFDDADITALMALNKKYAASYEQKGTRLTLTSFALKAVVDTLRKHPILNSSLDAGRGVLVLKEYFHIGVAVDTEAGLIVPVIRDVDKKSLLELSKELEELAKKARERKITSEELKGGTLTISNQGGIGSGHFTPIVNHPEVAILGLGRGALKAVVRGDKIEPRLMLPLALSYDHRVIDGAAAARFMVDLVKAIENFGEDMIRI